MMGVETALPVMVHSVAVDGIRITRTRDGSQHAGSARASTGDTLVAQRTHKSRAHTVRLIADVEVNENLDASAMYATLAHELAHIYCGHQGHTILGKRASRESLSKEIRKIEAEAVAYIACLRLDPEAELPPDLHRYLTPGSPPPPVDLDLVTRAAGRVIDLWESPEQVWRVLPR